MHPVCTCLPRGEQRPHTSGVSNSCTYCNLCVYACVCLCGVAPGHAALWKREGQQKRGCEGLIQGEREREGGGAG